MPAGNKQRRPFLFNCSVCKQRSVIRGKCASVFCYWPALGSRGPRPSTRRRTAAQRPAAAALCSPTGWAPLLNVHRQPWRRRRNHTSVRRSGTRRLQAHLVSALHQQQNLTFSPSWLGCLQLAGAPDARMFLPSAYTSAVSAKVVSMSTRVNFGKMHFISVLRYGKNLCS